MVLLIVMGMMASCNESKKHSQNKLPYYGPFELLKNTSGGSDTIWYTVPKFSFINQDKKEVSNHHTDGKIMVVEFFFTTCPSICPMITSQLSRLQVLMATEGLSDKVTILSHTVDPSTDTPDVMKAYANALGADDKNWHFLTGRAEDLYYHAAKGYMVPAFPSDTAAGGFFHTDQLTLVDGERHIRGYYDGTSTSEVDSLYNDIKKLLNEH